MDVRVDERGREHEPPPLDDAVPVRADVEPDLGDHAGVDADVEQVVDALARVDHARAADDEVVLVAVLADTASRHLLLLLRPWT